MGVFQMSAFKYARLVDTENFVFEILELLFIQPPVSLLWYSEDFNNGVHFGHCFRGYFENDMPNEKAYIIIADVTKDNEEPNISNISNIDVEKIDKKLHSNIEQALKQQNLNLIRWMNSHLNHIYNRNVLVTAYIVEDPIVGQRQRICSRMEVKSRKIAIEVCFNIADANILAKPIFTAMHPVGIAE